jgi:ADYC domain-containing protein
MKKLSITCLAPLVALTACAVEPGAEDEPQYGEVENLVQSGNGTSLNGTSLNGTSLNGTSLNGSTLGSVSVSGQNASGGAVTAAYSSTTTPPLSGSSWVGSKWTGTASNGVSLSLKIVSGAALASPNSEVWEYEVQYQNSGGWQPLCGLDTSSVPIKAITVAGTWSVSTATWASSTTQFTIACRAKSIAKCVELGYKSYKGYSNQMASCVRMLRADYCGNNVSYTVDGQVLNVYDNLGIQLDTQTWTKEGAWAPTGAKCLRTGGKIRYVYLGTGTPSCASALYTSTCGDSFGSGQYIIDEIQ